MIDIEVRWVGINHNKRIWGLLKVITSDDDFYNHRFYTFWGTNNGALLFSRTYQSFRSMRNQRSKRCYDEVTDINVGLSEKIKYDFSQFLTVQRLKNSI